MDGDLPRRVVIRTESRLAWRLSRNLARYATNAQIGELEMIKMATSEVGDIKQRVHEIIAEEIEMDVGELDQTASFIDEYGADSMSLIQVFGRIERELGLQIPQEEMDNMTDLQTVDEIVGKYA
jgi:acyl carrier protein